MTTRDEFLEKAKFTMSENDEGQHYITGTLSADVIHQGGRKEKKTVYMNTQGVIPEDLEAAREFCKTKTGPFRDKINFGADMRPFDPFPS